MSEKNQQFVVDEPTRRPGDDHVAPGWQPGDKPRVIKAPDGFDAVALFERWVTPAVHASMVRIKGDEFVRAEQLIRNGTPEEAYVAWRLLSCWLAMWDQAQD